MYMRTTGGLAQVPRRYGFFAGMLGEPALPARIQKFLDRVKRSPQDYEALLLIIDFHVEPWSSDQLQRLFSSIVPSDTKDPFEETREIQEKIFQSLESIHKNHLGDKSFSQLVMKEKQLISAVAKAFTNKIKELETKGWLEPFLIDALLTRSSPIEITAEVGKPFALYQLPDEITEQILNSRVPETHYARLGNAIQLMAEQRQKDNAAFKKRVEKERKKQGK